MMANARRNLARRAAGTRFECWELSADCRLNLAILLAGPLSTVRVLSGSPFLSSGGSSDG